MYSAMDTSRANPTPIDHVLIDMPVAYGYPVPPPPMGDGAALDDTDDYGLLSRPRIILMLVALIVVFIISIILDLNVKLPRFHLDSVNVAVVNSTAVWDIGFSIDKSLRDLNVWVRFMGRDFKVESLGSAGQATVSVSTLLPAGGGFDLSGGLRLDQVMFRCSNYRNYVLEAACKDVKVGFSMNETRGVLNGGPRLCPVVGHGPHGHV